MTQDQLQQMYQELEQLSQVHIDPSTELGPKYLLDKLWECRRGQDRLQSLTVGVHREVSGLKKASRSQKAQVALLKRAIGREAELYTAEVELRKTEDQLDDLNALEKVLGVARYNLKITDSDLRLATRLYEAQARLGAHIPPPPDERPVAEVPSVFREPPKAPVFVEPTGLAEPSVVVSAADFYKAMEGL